MSTTVNENKSLPVAALVVGYRPDLATLDTLLSGLLAEVQFVMLLNNGGADGYLLDSETTRKRVRYVDMGGNSGLGAALNRGMQEARDAGLRYVITFDQDSAPLSGMVKALYDAMLHQQAAGIPCAAVGPCFYDLRDKETRFFPVYKEEEGRIEVFQADQTHGVHEVDVLITSGMLIDSNVWEAGLKYDERLFIDYTDTDWCFRARSMGKRLFVLATAHMPHALSSAPPVRVFGLRLLCYPPLRRYYYFRNTAYFVRQHYVSLAWRRRLLAGLLVRLIANPLIDSERLLGTRMSIKGLWHGLRNRLGEFSH